jgi:hypothetical protein
MSQKTGLFITTAVRDSNLARNSEMEGMSMKW